MRKRRLWAAAALLCATHAYAASDAPLVVAEFSRSQPGAGLPNGWRPLAVSGARAPTVYTLVDDGGTTVLRARSDAAASGLTRALPVDPAEYPLLRWKWKVGNLIARADISRRDRDDYPARLYVMFDYPIEKLPLAERAKLRLARALHGADLPAAALCYVWDGKAAAGTIRASAYTSRVRMVVVESGAARLGRWVEFERDVVRDFRSAFGEEPPAISAVALASDTDNTGASVTAFFGDISLHKRVVTR